MEQKHRSAHDTGSEEIEYKLSTHYATFSCQDTWVI